MKTLFVMRHAKSSWGEPGLDDFYRPLLEKGKKRTKLIIDYLMHKQLIPELILCSPAVRANDTAKIMAHGLGLTEDQVLVEKSIYTADVDQLENLFFDLPSSVNRLMLIGHNPSLTEFINRYLENKLDALPTSAVVAIDYKANKWEEVLDSEASVNFIIFPKMLGKD